MLNDEFREPCHNMALPTWCRKATPHKNKTIANYNDQSRHERVVHTRRRTVWKMRFPML